MCCSIKFVRYGNQNQGEKAGERMPGSEGGRGV